MFKNLSPEAIGIHGLSLSEAIALAREAGFAGLAFDIRAAAALAEKHGVEYVRAIFDDGGIVPGHWGFPVAWMDDDRWRRDLDDLPRLAALARELGCTRTATWCPPTSDERPYAENLRWHADRFRPIAEVLKEYGCRLGLEFIGPKTLRTGRYDFVYNLEGMMELIAAIGAGNVGLLLDSWHLYTSGGRVDDLDAITAQDIVVVHVNDAPAGVPRDEQVDNVRCLPMETGVIDLPAFVRKLEAMGYDGPLTPEPFNARINAIAAQDPLRAARIVSEHMDRMWQAG